MKKTMMMLLALLLVASLCACGGSESADNKETTTVETTTAATETTTVETTTAAPEPSKYTFGDTINTNEGMFSFTPEFCGFAKGVANWPDENYLTPDGKGVDDSKNPFIAEEGKTMMYFSGVVEFIGDSKQNETFSLSGKIDYDNGYVFDKMEGTAFSADEAKWNYGNSVTFEPLGANKTSHVRFCFEVPDAVETDTSKETLVIFTIGGEEFIFVADTAAAAQAKADREAAAAAEEAHKMEPVDEALAEEIKNKLQGTWSWTIYGYAGTSMYTTKHDLTFSKDKVTIETTNSLLNTRMSNKGTYTICNGYIVLDFEDGAQARMPYTYENGQVNMSQEFEGAFYKL